MNSESHGLKLAAGVLVAAVGTEQCGVPRAEHELPDAVWPELSAELSRLALALSLTADQAEDAVQDVYVQALRKCPAGLSRAELRRWVFRVATNRFRLEHRRRKRWTRAFAALTKSWHRENGRTAQTSLEETGTRSRADERRHVVQKGLSALEPEMRTLLVLRYFAGFNSREIGRVFDMPDSTVRSHLRQARLRLARELEGSGYDEA
jgi:RNA polymerase sigma-70 factor (ECF subfamily)